MRIGGEYREEGDRDRTRWEARKIFLDMVSDQVSDVLKTLRDEVLPSYKRAYDETKPSPSTSKQKTPFGTDVTRQLPPGWIRWSWRDGDWDIDQDDQPPELLEFRKRLLRWGEDWNLPETWVLDASLRTLRRWRARQNQGSEIALEFEPLPFADVSDKPAFTFEFSAWTPRWTSWAEYSKELREAFEDQLETYREQRQAEASERGLKKSPTKLGQADSAATQHFEWLVRFQVKEHTISRIANDASRSEQTVQDALRSTADLVGLRRRSLQ